MAFIPAGILESCKKQNYSGPSNVNFTIDLSLAANAALNTVGGAVTGDNGQIVVIHTSSGFIALSNVCTHEGCIVNYNSGSQQFTCPCHDGVYNQQGAVVSGPPPSALTKYTVTQSGSILTIKS